MEYVKCVKENPLCLVGETYWQDVKDTFTSEDGKECSYYYKDEQKRKPIGYVPNECFKVRYRFLLFGDSLGNWINEEYSFMLKDIINWCCNNQSHQMSYNLLFFITRELGDYSDLLEKEFFVKSKSFNQMVAEGKEKEYEKYSGYYLVAK